MHLDEPHFDELRDWLARPALEHDPRPGTRQLASTALGMLGIELVECGPTRVVARTAPGAGPDARGSLLVLAETVASTAAGLAAGRERRAFGAELNASWPAPPRAGTAVAIATPLELGADLHVWRIVVLDEDSRQLLEGRCTLGIVDAPAG